MNAYILSTEDETIAVIQEKENIHDFFVKVRTAYAEHFCIENVDDVSMNNADFDSIPVEFEMDSEEDVRKCFLTFTALY